MTDRRCLVCGNIFLSKSANSSYCSRLCIGLHKSRTANPSLVESYFQTIDTPEKAYWLGFLMADGSMLQRGNHFTLSFFLAEKDEDRVQQFARAVGVSSLQRRKSATAVLGGKVVRSSPLVGVQIGNTKFTTHLFNAGLVPNKSKRLRLPRLGSRTLMLALLLGFFDGDGTAGVSPVVVSASFRFLRQVRRYFHTKTEVRTLRHGFYGLCLSARVYEKMLGAYEHSMPRKRCLKRDRVPRNSHCAACGKILPAPKSGRRLGRVRVYCSKSCTWQAHKAHHSTAFEATSCGC